MSRLRTSILAITFCASLAASTSARESWVGLNLRAQVLYIEMNELSTTNWGLGAEGSFFPHKRLLLEGRYSISNFSNGNAANYKDYYLADASPEIKPFSYWEAGGQFNLICKSGEYENSSSHYDSTTSSRDVNNKSYTNWYTKHTWLASEYQLYGIRGGIFEANSGMPADLGDDADTIRQANGVIVDPAFRDLTYTNHKMTGYYVGIAKTRVYYKEGLWRTVYIDVLVKSKTEYKDPVLTGFTERKYGGRVGVEGARRSIGGRLEAGVRPGVDRLYVLAQFSIGLML